MIYRSFSGSFSSSVPLMMKLHSSFIYRLVPYLLPLQHNWLASLQLLFKHGAVGPAEPNTHSWETAGHGLDLLNKLSITGRAKNSPP